MALCNQAEAQWSWSPLEETQGGKKLKTVYIRVTKNKDHSPPTLDGNKQFQWHALDFNALSSSFSSSIAAAGFCGNLSPAIMTMPPDVPNHNTAFAMGSRIYVIGGRSLAAHNRRIPIMHDKVFSYDTDCPEKGWKEGPAMISGRQNPAAVAVDGKIYVFGGNYYNYDQSLYAEVFDPLLDRWEVLPQPTYELPPFVAPLHALLLDTQGNKHLLICPSVGSAAYTYNLDAKSWSMFDPSFIPYAGFWRSKAAAVDGVLYCYDEAEVLAYDLVERRWFSEPVKGFDDKNSYPNNYIPGHMLHIGHGKLCLLWYNSLSLNQHTIYCTIFTVRRCHVEGEGSLLLAHIESTRYYHADGQTLVDCVAL